MPRILSKKKKSNNGAASKLATQHSKEEKENGRPRDIEIEDLRDRHRIAKSFLESHWGLFSLDLKCVKQPAEVGAIFKRVRGVEGMELFRNHGRCLISDSGVPASSQEIRFTRRRRKAVKEENRAWYAYHETNARSTATHNLANPKA
jgi:hypothetical protein